MAQHHNAVQPSYTVSLIPYQSRESQVCVLHDCVLSTELYKVWHGDQLQFSRDIFHTSSRERSVGINKLVT